MPASTVRPKFPLMMMLIVVSSAIFAGLLFTGTEVEPARSIQRAMALLVPLGVLVFSIFWSAQQSAELRDEDRRVSALEDAARLQRFDWLTHALTDALSRPMRSPLHRVRALQVYVTTLVGVGRFDDAERSAAAMLGEGVPLGMVTSLRALRVYAMLREDRLVDADRALGELRRQDRDIDISGHAPAMVALAAMYRDAVTGHCDDALRSFEKNRPAIAKQLGLRVADADALAAHSALTLGQSSRAAHLWRRATLFASPAELVHRFPPLSTTSAALAPASVPPELAIGGAR